MFAFFPTHDGGFFLSPVAASLGLPVFISLFLHMHFDKSMFYMANAKCFFLCSFFFVCGNERTK